MRRIVSTLARASMVGTLAWMAALEITLATDIDISLLAVRTAHADESARSVRRSTTSEASAVRRAPNKLPSAQAMPEFKRLPTPTTAAKLKPRAIAYPKTTETVERPMPREDTRDLQTRLADYRRAYSRGQDVKAASEVVATSHTEPVADVPPSPTDAVAHGPGEEVGSSAVEAVADENVAQEDTASDANGVVSPMDSREQPEPFAYPATGTSSIGPDKVETDTRDDTQTFAPTATELKTLESAVAQPTQANGAVVLNWTTPSSISLAQEATCELAVRNTSDGVAHGVVVRVQLPDNVEPGTTEPAAIGEGRMLTWKLGDMQGRSTTRLQVTFTPRAQGDLSPRASVTFTRAAVANIAVVEPKLELLIEGPAEAMIAQQTEYSFRVINTGSGLAANVAVDVALAPGLDAAKGAQSRYEIGALEPGESRQVQMHIAGKTAGEYGIRARAVLGDVACDTAEHAIQVVQPALEVKVEGPKLRFLDRKATFVVEVHNPNASTIDNVQLVESIPEGFRFVEASSGGNFDRVARQVAWFVGRLDANESAQVAVHLTAVEEGSHRLAAAARSDFGLLGEAEFRTEIKGAPRVVIEVNEDDDPVEVEGETVYRIRLTNQGSLPARSVQFAAEVPKEMRVLKADGPAVGTINQQQVVFPPIDSLEPGQTVTYDVHVHCLKAGQVRFQAFFRSEDSATPVLEEESTRIYAD